MARKRYTSEQIIGYLRQEEILSPQGRSVSEICRETGGNSVHLLPLAKGIRRHGSRSGKEIKGTRALELRA